MSLSLNVLNHLGLNLYSNVPAVLAEAVANSWDADAENVGISIDAVRGEIVIEDDGDGMTAQDINKRYLHVGYQRRTDGHGKTLRLRRPVMGRKGIGKLSLFSIAEEIEVQSSKSGEQNGFVMRVADIQDQIESGKASYDPEELSDDDLSVTQGTRIALRSLKKRTDGAEAALRRRLARRFSVIGAKKRFQIALNDVAIGIEDRDYFHKIQYVWTYGRHKEIQELCSKAEHKAKRVTKAGTFKVSGWIGTVRKSTDLREDSKSLNQIVVMVRGKLAQEDVLDVFGEGGIYTKYVIGELHADFLDADDEDDIATSSRQSIIEDDPRYQALLSFVRAELKHIGSQWTHLRNRAGTTAALEVPAIKAWFGGLGPDSRKRAERLFGNINQLTIDSDAERNRLFKHSVLAFESLRYKENLDALERITPDNIEAIAPILANLDDIEASLYRQIAQERVAVIKALTEKVEEDAKEGVIQQHLFDHLWLLDPSWERAATTEYMESTVAKEFGKEDAGLSPEEKAGRRDIKYRATSGKHVVIELKRAGRSVKEAEIQEQLTKYLRAVDKILESQDRHQPVEGVVVLGKWPSDWSRKADRERGEAALAAHRIRVVRYESLIENAAQAYQSYVDASATVGRVAKLLEAIDLETGDEA